MCPLLATSHSHAEGTGALGLLQATPSLADCGILVFKEASGRECVAQHTQRGSKNKGDPGMMNAEESKHYEALNTCMGPCCCCLSLLVVLGRLKFSTW